MAKIRIRRASGKGMPKSSVTRSVPRQRLTMRGGKKLSKPRGYGY